ncbi:uncharacterized protein LOC128386952 [Panonychus citri]|uniref:uncharacterized protein LOC128386952 n=1 Tax=Panonychus citri TaxID=50023 RepID=UPI002307E7F1|nr:uncharacterized protein LOC128386952 [Panonychus citri]
MVKLSELSDKQLDPRECQYRLNGKIRKIISKCLDKQDDHDDSLDKLKTIMDQEEGNKQMVSYDDLTEIHKCLQHLDSTYQLFFYQLLEETNTIIPKNNKAPELKARLARLKCEAAAKEYKAMTDGINLVPSNSKQNQASANSINEVRQIKTLITALINGVMVVFCSFFFVYKAVEYSLPQPNINTQILVAIIVIVDLYCIAQLQYLKISLVPLMIIFFYMNKLMFLSNRC